VSWSKDEVIRLFSEFLEGYAGANPFGDRPLDVAALSPVLSFVSPCFNEAENLPELCRRIAEACRSTGIEDYEVLLIENGSHDGSEEIMEGLRAENPRIRIIALSRNFGYQGAITCGLEHSRGRWVAILDGDLQDPPELIPQMLEKARGGYEVVYGVRARRREGPLKQLAYYLFYRLWRSTSEIQVPLDAGDFCVMHRAVVDAINSSPERQRFVRGLRAWSGFRQVGYPYDRSARHLGETKFNLRNMLNLALDGLLAYSIFPLRLTLVLGLGLVGVALTLESVQFILRLLAYAGFHGVRGYPPPGLTQINLLLILMGGIVTACVGVVGEYIGRIYTEVKQRPIYIVKRSTGGVGEASPHGSRRCR
jgi:glycosyltransferase involved in cell wall biosynthesis